MASKPASHQKGPVECAPIDAQRNLTTLIRLYRLGLLIREPHSLRTEIRFDQTRCDRIDPNSETRKFQRPATSHMLKCGLACGIDASSIAIRVSQAVMRESALKRSLRRIFRILFIAKNLEGSSESFQSMTLTQAWVAGSSSGQDCGANIRFRKLDYGANYHRGWRP